MAKKKGRTNPAGKSKRSRDAKKEMEISLAAGEIVGKLYDALLKQYKDPNNEESLKA